MRKLAVKFLENNPTNFKVRLFCKVQAQYQAETNKVKKLSHYPNYKMAVFNQSLIQMTTHLLLRNSKKQC